MAKNDVVLVDGIIEQRREEGRPSSDIGEVFELFVLEEVLKDYDLTTDELHFGWLDGRDDGGIDGFYIFVNGHLLEDTDEFNWPKSHALIEIWIITCKHHATFQQAPLDLLYSTVHEFFDLSVSNADLKGSYSEDLVAARSLFSHAYRKLSIGRPTLKFNLAYVSRGDASDLGDSVKARTRQIEDELTNLFSSCQATFHFVGAAELVTSHRKTKSFSLDLPFLEHLATGKDSYVLLVKLEDYWRFVSDSNDHLRRYLFDSNVRDYLGYNQVNEEIAKSLDDPTAPDFWWLNNGVTILATAATVPGKTIQLQDIQIVNGLQTTETIFEHFSSGKLSSRDRALLVKIIVSSDEQARDRIIRATNNQSPVEIAALRATDKIQRDIEEILERHDWFYERRKNYHRNVGKPFARFVTPVYLASAVVSLIFRNPLRATHLRSKFMRDQIGYEAVFSDAFPIEVWAALSNIYKQVDANLTTAVLSSRESGGERFIAKWRPLVALIAVARRLKKFDYTPLELTQLSSSSFTSDEITEIWKLISETAGDKIRRGPPGRQITEATCAAAATTFGLQGIELVGRRDIPTQPSLSPAKHSPPQQTAEVLTPDFLDMVDVLLPDQPWKPGIHIEVANKLNCKKNQVSRAIAQLMNDGRRLVQRDGVVYDHAGNIHAIDTNRVPLSIDELQAKRTIYTGSNL